MLKLYEKSAAKQAYSAWVNENLIGISTNCVGK